MFGRGRCCNRRCDFTTTTTQLCNGCHSASFCGVPCQRAAWPSHKIDCKHLSSFLTRHGRAFCDVQANEYAALAEAGEVLAMMLAAQTCRDNGDYASALELDMRAAAGGYAAASYAVGVALKQAGNIQGAREAHAIAAAAGVPAAFGALGKIDKQGGGEGATERARKYFEQGDRLGCGFSSLHFAHILFKERKLVEAFDAFNRALTDKQNPAVTTEAQEFLGVFHEKGYGCEISVDNALNYYKLATRGGSVASPFNMGLMLAKLKLYPAARKSHEIAAARGSGSAMNSLGTMAQFGLGLSAPDMRAAASWFERAAAAGNTSGKYNLAVFLVGQGEGLLKYIERANELAHEAAATGHPDAMAMAGALDCLQAIHQPDFEVAFAAGRELIDRSAAAGSQTGAMLAAEYSKPLLPGQRPSIIFPSFSPAVLGIENVWDENGIFIPLNKRI